MASENENDFPSDLGGSTPAPNEGSQGGLTQADIDRLLAGEILGEDASAETPDPEPMPADPVADVPEVLAQSDIDRLIAEQLAATTSPAATEDTLLAAHEGLEDSLARGGEEDVLGAGGMDEALVAPAAAPSDEDTELAKIESLLNDIEGASHMEDTASTDDDDLGLDQSMVDSLLQQARAEEVPDPDEIQLHDIPPVVEPIVVPPPSAPPELDDALLAGPDPAEPTEETKDAKPKRALFPVEWWKNHGNKAITSLAAGLVAAFATYSFLNGFSPSRATDPTPAPIEGVNPIAAVVQTARDLIAQNQPGEAASLLEATFTQTPSAATSPDAAYLMAKARYIELPQTPSMQEASLTHNAIDDFSAAAPGDPRLPEALQWKADVFERTDIPLAALDIYKTLVSQFANIAGMDSVLLKAGKAALKVGRAPEAFDFLRRLQEEFPGSDHMQEARLLLGDAHAAAGEIEQAATLYTEVASSAPRTRTDPDVVSEHNRLVATAFTRLARIAFDAGRYTEAAQLLESRLQTATTADGNEQIYMLLAKSYQMEGKLAEAEQKLRELLDFFPESEVTPEAYVLLSDLLANQGKQEEALRLASEATNRFPEADKVLQTKAELLKRTGDLKGAAQVLMAADAAGKSEAATQLEAGRLFHRLENLTDAQFVLEKLLAEHPNAPEAFDAAVELASVQFDRGRAGEAITRMTGLMESAGGTPRELPVALGSARMYDTLGLRDKSAELYKRVASLTSEPGILAESAMSLFNAKLWSEGMAVADRVDATALTPDQAYGFDMAFGRALLQLDVPRGIQLMELVYNTYPDLRTAEDEATLMDAYLATDNIDAAKGMVAQAEAYAATNPMAIPRLHDLAVRLGDRLYQREAYEEAAAIYAKAQGNDLYAGESSEWAAFQQANVLQKLGQLDQSLTLYDSIAESMSPWSDDAELRANVVRLEQRIKGGVPTPAAVG